MLTHATRAAVLELLHLGLDLESVAAAVGVTVDAIEAERRSDPAFAVAVERLTPALPLAEGTP